ncbi:unnamed protein product [Caenorhabditis nigoni]
MLKIAVFLAVVALSSSLSIARPAPVDLDPPVELPVDPIDPTIDVPLPWYPWYPCYPYYPMSLEGTGGIKPAKLIKYPCYYIDPIDYPISLPAEQA